jgi:acyl-CoA thioesterase FadM
MGDGQATAGGGGAPVHEGGPPPWAGYRFVKDIVTEPVENSLHLHNLAIAELLFQARNAYITEGVGMRWQDLFDTGRNMIMRRLTIDYEREVARGVPLRLGVRAIARSRRTLTLEEAVWRVEPAQPIAVARSVHLVVRFDTPGSIELPDDVVGQFEAYEGGKLPSAAA